MIIGKIILKSCNDNVRPNNQLIFLFLITMICIFLITVSFLSNGSDTDMS